MTDGPPPPDGGAGPRALPPQLMHDLRTPLTQIIGYSELVAEEAEAAGHGAFAPDLRKVSAAGYRLLALLDEHFRAEPALETEPAGPTTLAAFIGANRETILAEWEAFARTCAPAGGVMDIAALRDHAGELLTAIAAELGTPRGGPERSERSKGHAPAAFGGGATAAEAHGAERAESGFTVGQMVAEYRALRASVIRLWMQSRRETTPADLEDLARFNEAVDLALAESIAQYTHDLDRSKEMFLAVLGHDLRTPLTAIAASARFVLGTQALEEPSLGLVSRIVRSSARMDHMVRDLLDFTRSRLGGGISLARADASAAAVVREVADEVRAAHPERALEVEAEGEPRGEWDAARISQALTNLVVNAVEHGSGEAPVRIGVAGDGEEVTVTIHNRGPAIPASRIDGIFNPMKGRNGGSSAADGPSGSLGLGLYIAERIVSAHGGRIDVASSDAEGTTFTVRLPRRPPAAR
ncbi:MAG TPA: sensor histidine kinase [Longimicrobium sp.]|nr:sensor histidine kinase [Longimicrobium sp.]